MKRILNIAFGILASAATTATALPQSEGSGRLSGAWDVVVTPRVCATGVAIPGGRGREQLGIWKHVNGKHYRFRIKTYLFDAAGIATSYQIVTHDGEIDKEGLRWSSTGDSRTFTLDGVETNVGCSTIVGSRVPEL